MATLSTAAKNAALDAISAILDTPGGPGADRCVIQMLTSGVSFLLSRQLSPSAPTFNAASGGSATLRLAPSEFTVNLGNGVAASYRLLDGAGTVHIQNFSAGVGLSGSGAEIEMDNTNMRVGQTIIVDSFELFIP